MRRFLSLLLMAVTFSSVALAQNYSIKAYAVRGAYLDKNHHFTKFGGIYPTGVTLGLEFPSAQQKPWQSYLNNPTVGVGLSGYDFGNDILGNCLAVYPYILLDAIDTEYFQMRFKIAGGLGYVTETWYTQEGETSKEYYSDESNTVFGSPFNIYLNAGVNLNVPVSKSLAFGAEFGYFHLSNGRTAMPNVGMNTIYGSVGLTTTIASECKKAPVNFPDLPYGWALNVTGAAGAHQAWMDEPKYLISTLHVGPVYHVNNWYGIGAGLDVFYNGAIDKGTARDLYCKGVNSDGRECLSCTDGDYTTADKMRAGISMNSEFKFGMITAIVDWGVYFYNPSRNYFYDYHDDHKETGIPERRPLFYTAPGGAGSEEAFNYFRFGLRCRVWDNIYVQATAKTHMHVAEYIEFGLGYQIPFLKKSNRKDRDDVIFHYSPQWWKRF